MALRMLAIICFFPFISPAQISSLIDDDNVSWIAEIYTDLNFDPTLTSKQTATATEEKPIPLKIIQQDTDQPSTTPFTDALVQCIKNKTWEAFSDKNLTQPLTESEMQGRFMIIDSISIFDPVTYEEKLYVQRTNLLQQINHFRLKKQWAFNQKTGQFNQYIVAIAPVFSFPEESFIPVWFKLPEAKAKYEDINNKHVKFAAHMSYHLAEKDIEAIKGSTFDLKSKWIEDLKSGRTSGYDNEFQAIPVAEVEELFVSTDTIYTIDPESYKETFELVQRDYRAEDLNHFKVLETWAFAPDKGTLQSKLKAVAPSVAITDEYGTLDYYLPLFFWRRE
jgi:hypothetical protein